METIRIREVWRYPVKSMGGERLDEVVATARGVHGDRLWAVRDLERDITVTARRMPALLQCRARYCEPPGPGAGPGDVPGVEITLPDGTVRRSDDADVDEVLSGFAGRAVRLTALPPVDDTSLHRLGERQRADSIGPEAIREAFGITDGEASPHPATIGRTSDLLTLARYSTPPGTFVDIAPLHLVTETSLATIAEHLGLPDLDVRRFRPNLLLAVDEPATDLPERTWVGGRLRGARAGLEVVMPTIRCVIPTRPQADLGLERGVTRALVERGERFLGAYAEVPEESRFAVGDRLELTLPGPVSRAVGAVTAAMAHRAVGLGQRVVDRRQGPGTPG